MSERPVAILGGGSIGVAFAIVFSRAGHPVRLFEPDDGRRQAIPGELTAKLELLADAGLLGNSPCADPAVLAAHVDITADVTEAVTGTVLVQECIPERVELKRTMFERIGPLTGAETVIASSSSAITASDSARGLACAGQVLVAHPGNPPYLIPVIELVPSPDTRPDIVRTAWEMYGRAGMSPVTLNGEVEGFVFNRLQGAVLREAYALVRDGVATVEDIDTVMRDGLGRRWSFMGPFETVDLNTRGGIASHAEKMGPAYERMGAERGQHDPWTAPLVAEVARQRRAVLPLEEWDQRVAWRDERLLQDLRTRDSAARFDA
jgi:L-gulonate 3-dehydrogenase